jgi:hypothetical protein
MKIQNIAPLAVAIALVAPLTSQANLSAYSQNFETLAPSGSGFGNAALGNDGWLIYANVFTAGGAYLYGYGPYAAPNGNAAFSGITGELAGLGGPQQGNQQLVVYSDYNNNGAHGSGQLVEALVFQQQTVGAGDVGTTWTFRFDARLYAPGGLLAPSTAQAFIKTLDPNNGFQATGFNSVDMSAVSETWGTYSLPLTITAGAGQILQFGFSSKATNYAGSAVTYDNISLTPVPEPTTYALMLAGLGLLGLVAGRRSR